MDYDLKARATAARMLAPKPKGKGQQVTLITPGQSHYDPATGATTTSAPRTETGSGLAEKISSFNIDEDKVRTGDIKFLLSPLTVAGAVITPPVEDQTKVVLASGEAWKVVRSEPESPAGLVIMYVLQLRRGS